MGSRLTSPQITSLCLLAVLSAPAQPSPAPVTVPDTVTYPATASAPATAPVPIEANWVYLSPLDWHPVEVVPGAEKERGTPATIAVFYPEGQYVEIVATLLTPGRHAHVRFSASDGLLMRVGSWARTDDRLIRVQSREVFHDDKLAPLIQCSLIQNGKHCVPAQPRPRGPLVTEMCGLAGRDPDHFASEIHCRHSSLSPLRIDLSVRDLDILAEDVLPQTSTP